MNTRSVEFDELGLSVVFQTLWLVHHAHRDTIGELSSAITLPVPHAASCFSALRSQLPTLSGGLGSQLHLRNRKASVWCARTEYSNAKRTRFP